MKPKTRAEVRAALEGWTYAPSPESLRRRAAFGRTVWTAGISPLSQQPEPTTP